MNRSLVFGVVLSVLIAMLIFLSSWDIKTVDQPDTGLRQSDIQTELVYLPKTISSECGYGTATYFDICANNVAMFGKARLLARKENKVVLVVLGSKWCFWCIAFNKFVRGEKYQFDYKIGVKGERLAMKAFHYTEPASGNAAKEARELRTYLARSFILLNISHTEFTTGLGVVDTTSNGSDAHIQAARQAREKQEPLIFSVDKYGYFVSYVKYKDAILKVPGESGYRGFDRNKLLKSLQGVYEAAAEQ